MRLHLADQPSPRWYPPQVISVARREPSERADRPDGAAAAAEVVASVRVHLPGGEQVAGEAAVEPEAATSTAEGLPRAKKAALTNALKAALAQLVIVRFASGKTVVRHAKRRAQPDEASSGGTSSAARGPARGGGEPARPADGRGAEAPLGGGGGYYVAVSRRAAGAAGKRRRDDADAWSDGGVSDDSSDQG